MLENRMTLMQNSNISEQAKSEVQKLMEKYIFSNMEKECNLVKDLLKHFPWSGARDWFVQGALTKKISIILADEDQIVNSLETRDFISKYC